MRELLKRLGIETENINLYIRAVTHPSYANEHNYENGHLERLEFMGDAVLQLMVSDMIFNFYKDMNEGEMSLVRSKLVRADSLANEAKKLGLDKVLNLGVGEEKSNGRNCKNILADSFEAFMAAIYLDKGFDFTFSFVKSIFENLVKTIDIEDMLDYKTKLQEIVQSDKQSVTYREVGHSGTSNNPIYFFEVLLDGDIVLATGEGSSKKRAQQDAAKKALEKCSK